MRPFRSSGAFRERLHSAWAEMRENPGRVTLQALGIVLGVASVLGGFSISDSQRRRAEEMFIKMGGLDKLNVMPMPVVTEGAQTALATANLGLRGQDATDGSETGGDLLTGVSVQRNATARVRSSYADQERPIRGIGGDFLALEGYEISEGRAFTEGDLDQAAPVAILGSEAAEVFFPQGDALGQVLRVGDLRVQVVGLFHERVFRFRKDQRNQFRRRNRIIALPASLVAQRLQGDVHRRLDRVTFRVRDLDKMLAFSKDINSVVKTNHRMQEDFRLDDVAARVKKEMSQGDVYNIIFWLSGILSLIGGGMVNVNIQLASLRERVREVGVKMAIGASGGEIFKEFMTEALLLTIAGGAAGLAFGVAFSWTITSAIGIPLYMAPSSFVWAFALAALFGFAFALYPAWRASRLSPMEALRYE